MDYAIIPIIETARRCGINTGANSSRAEIEVNCPFCHDRKKHMSLNTVKDVFRCNRCGVSGNSVTLYAKIMNIDTKTAYKELSGGGITRIPVLNRKDKPHPHEIKPLLERHNVYHDMLYLLKLSVKHRNDLISRGMNGGVIERNMYRSMPDKGTKIYSVLAYELSKRHDLLGVPGFYYEYGKWRFTHKNGLLIPILDKDGYIQGLQIRLDDETRRKYRWFSSNHYEYGTSAVPWIHVADRDNNGIAYVTEGALKADAASYLMGGGCIIAVSGVNCINGLTGVLADIGITQVMEAFDMDKKTNPNVANAVERFKQDIIAAGFRLQNMTWDSRYNGIDEYYKAMYMRQNGINAA